MTRYWLQRKHHEADLFLLSPADRSEVPHNDLIRREKLSALTVDGYRLLWRKDENIRIERTDSELRILMSDPPAKTYVEYLRLNYELRRLSAHRPWPGSRSIYVRSDGQLLVTTHLRLTVNDRTGHERDPQLMNAGQTITFEREGRRHKLVAIEQESLDGPSPCSLEFAAHCAKSALRDIMAKAPRNSAILLSGGVDSAVLAASAPTVPCLTWTTARASRSQAALSDVAAARRVAEYLSLTHEIVLLKAGNICRNVEAAIILSETRRGTFIDDAVVYVQIAQHLRRRGIDTAFIGEAADDVFGCLPYNLRYYQGDELLSKLRRSLMEGAPADFAAMARIFAHFGVALVDPYLSALIVALGYRLPLQMRIDANRLMKPVLREAFAHDLPREIVQRRKCVSRDVSGVREIMADAFGVSRERFLPIFKSLFRDIGAENRQNAVLNALAKA